MKTQRIPLFLFICLLFSCESIEDKALKGDLNAQLRLAYCYETGDSIGICDIEKAKFYYELAGKQGNLLSQKWLIHFYDSINDAKNVFAWYEISANQGNREAQHHLGDFYKWGWDPVASDTLKAINWYQKAANQNDTLALFKMGELWYYKNEKKGLELITKAAELKLSDACHFLGNYYSTIKDTEKTMFWYKKQFEAGDPYGYYYIGNYLLSKEKEPSKETIISALNYYEIAYVYFKDEGDTAKAIAMAENVEMMYELLNKYTDNYYLTDVAEWSLKSNDYQKAGEIYVKLHEWWEAYNCYAQWGDKEQLDKLRNLCSINLRNYDKTTNEWLAYHYYEVHNFNHHCATDQVSFGVEKTNEIDITLRVSITDNQICSNPRFYYTTRDGIVTNFDINVDMNQIKSGVEGEFFFRTRYEYFTLKLKKEQIYNFKDFIHGSNQKIVINNGKENITRILREREINNMRLMMEAYEMVGIIYYAK